jgi:dolichol-phosphate mannosyltransferase
MNLNGRCLVIIPTYNEIENIFEIIMAVLSKDSIIDVLIVDDNSQDGTSQKVEEMKLANRRIHLLQREGKLGLGTAYVAGFQYSLAHGYSYTMEMDADFSHDPDDLPRLLGPCKDGTVDFTIGSRYVSGGKVVNWPLDRLILSYGASIYVRLITWMPIKDPTAGFICYTHKVLQSLDLETPRFQGYAFQIELKYEAYLKKFRYKEVFITFKDRVKGTSKMNKSIIKEAIVGVLSLRWQAYKGKYKSRIY